MPTHPPHVLVSAKVLSQSRRAKGGYFFAENHLKPAGLALDLSFSSSEIACFVVF
jgi:hypothetical protein